MKEGVIVVIGERVFVKIGDLKYPIDKDTQPPIEMLKDDVKVKGHFLRMNVFEILEIE